MKTFLDEPEPKKGMNMMFVVAVLIGIGLVAGLLGLVSMKKSTQQIQVDAMEGAYREGSPEFALYTRKIIAETDTERTQQSPTGMGTIVMSIRGNILNITGKTLTGLEIKVTVVDSNDQPVKDKTTVIIPKEVEKLESGKTLPVQVTIEGFNKDDDRANIRWKVTAIKIQE
jgi:hypothetical protein